MGRSQFVYSSIDEHSGGFHFLAVMNNTGMNICVHQFMWTYISISLVYIPKSGVAGASGNIVFNILRNCHIVFQSGFTILCSH